MDITDIFQVSFFCFYPNGSHVVHVQSMPVFDIPRWIEAYKFTHPACSAISCKLWFVPEV